MNKARFITLWREASLAAAEDTAERIYAELDRHYADAQRHYHSWNHIRVLLGMFDRVKAHAQHPVALELAIWFHDVIYSTTAKNNERKSADLFLARSQGVLPDALRAQVERLIMATEHPDPERLAQGDEQLLTDIDLLSFATDRDSFLKDTANIRKEFGDVPDREYYPSQVRFLSGLSQRDSFYSSPLFREHFEARARDNLNHLLGLLEAQGYCAVENS